MKPEKKKIMSILFSALYPGAGHLYEERYLPGTAAVILTTWSLLAFFVSFIIFNPSAGPGKVLFSVSLLVLGGLWAVCLASTLLRGVRIRRPSADRKALYTEGYSLFLQKKYEESLKVFRRLLKTYPEETAACLMTARIYTCMELFKKSRRTCKYLLRRTQNPLWKWEIRTELDACSSPER